jgi:hypothetical protein
MPLPGNSQEQGPSVIDSVVIKLSRHGALPPALLPDSLYGWAQCEKRPSL